MFGFFTALSERLFQPCSFHIRICQLNNIVKTLETGFEVIRSPFQLTYVFSAKPEMRSKYISICVSEMGTILCVVDNSFLVLKGSMTSIGAMQQ